MTLDQAKFIADHDLSMYSREELTAALVRLRQAGVVSRFRNVKNERSRERYMRRLVRLQNKIETIANQDEAKRVG